MSVFVEVVGDRALFTAVHSPRKVKPDKHREGSMAYQILEIARDSPGGLMPKDFVRMLPSVQPENIYGELSRLKKSGDLLKEVRRYRLPTNAKPGPTGEGN